MVNRKGIDQALLYFGLIMLGLIVVAVGYVIYKNGVGGTVSSILGVIGGIGP